MMDGSVRDALAEMAELDLGYPAAIIEATWDELEENATGDEFMSSDYGPDVIKKVRGMFERQMKAVLEQDTGTKEWQDKYLTHYDDEPKSIADKE